MAEVVAVIAVVGVESWATAQPVLSWATAQPVLSSAPRRPW
jgi:hypothetical protein